MKKNYLVVHIERFQLFYLLPSKNTCENYLGLPHYYVYTYTVDLRTLVVYIKPSFKMGRLQKLMIFLFLYIPLSSNIPQWPGWQVHPWKNNIPILYPDPGREEHRKDATSGSQETGNKGACGKPTGLPAGWPTCWSNISWKRRTTFLRIRSPLYFGGLSAFRCA